MLSDNRVLIDVGFHGYKLSVRQTEVVGLKIIHEWLPGVWQSFQQRRVAVWQVKKWPILQKMPAYQPLPCKSPTPSVTRKVLTPPRIKRNAPLKALAYIKRPIAKELLKLIGFSRLAVIVKSRQENFMRRLRFVRWAIPIHHQKAESEWNARISRLQQWRDECEKNTCDGCGNHKELCLCKVHPGLHKLTQLIRLSGKLHPDGLSIGAIKTDCIGWLSGKAGQRGCGPASWDNAVKAIEDG